MSTSCFLDPLVCGESLKKELQVRSKAYYVATVSAKNLPIYEDQGWYIVRENLKSFRIQLDKTVHELIEDQIWTLYARLGFKELNKNREFRVECGDGTCRKIDLFAKDDEVVLITECTSAEEPGTRKALTPLIDKIKSYRKDVVKATRSHYGVGFQPKFGWLIATRNIAWSDQDLKRAEEADIAVLRDEQIDYFAELYKLLRTSARYQFLATIFPGKSIKELKLQIPATEGKMGGNKYYTFCMRPSQLLKIAYVGHRNIKGKDALDTYQRMLKTRRLKDIAEYINNGGKFPTNIVVNLQYGRKLRFDKKEEIGELRFGTLELPNSYATAWIIDGQHRLYGYAFSDRADDSLVPVLAFVNLDPTTQKNLFVDINHKQVKVPRGLLLDLYSELHWGSDNPKEALTSLCSKITKTLGSSINSPLYKRIVIGEDRKTSQRCLTITTIATALRKEQLIGKPEGSNQVLIPGPLGHKDIDRALKRASQFLGLYFDQFKIALPEQWELGDAKGGYICTNNCIVALLKVLKSILYVLESNDSIDVASQSTDDLFTEVKRYLNPLLAWLQSLSPEKYSSLRSKVGSKGQIHVSWEMKKAIHDQDESFQPIGLKQWEESFDRSGTQNAKPQIDQIQLAMNRLTLHMLGKHYGENWWFEGVPNAVRLKCAARRQEEKGKHKIEQYLDLIDYKTIASSSSNWSKIFQPYFSLGDQQGTKAEKLNWIGKLNEIRKTVSHPERGLLKKEQVEFVQNLYTQLKEKLKEYWTE